MPHRQRWKDVRLLIMFITLVNPPTLQRGVRLSELQPETPQTPYYDRLRTADAYSPIDGRSSLPGEHLGLQSMAASLRAAGHEVDIVNGCAHRHSTLHQTVSRIDPTSDVIGLTGTSDLFAEMAWLARRIRQRGFTGPIVVGHDFATLNDARLLETVSDFTFIVRGSGERTLVRLLADLDRAIGDPPPGVTVRRPGGDIARGAPAEAVDLDSLPLVARDDLPAVLEAGLSAGVFTKRGCPFRCSFCTTGAVPSSLGLRRDQRWVARSPIAAASELAALADRYGVSHVTVVDDLFVGMDEASRRWAADFADALIRLGSPVTWMADVRVDSVDLELFALLRRSGLRRVFVGVETASKAAQRSFGKLYREGRLAAATEDLARLEIHVILGFIMFSPLETVQGLLESAAYLDEAGYEDYRLLLQEVRVYPGTALEASLRDAGLLRGEFPYYRFEYDSPDVGLIASVVTALGRAIDDVARDGLGHASMAGPWRRMLTVIRGLCELAHADDLSAASAAALVAEVFPDLSAAPLGCPAR